MNKNLVFFDIDGTLLPYGEKQIHRDVISAIDEIKNEQTEVFICTGRCREQAREYIEALATESFICSNGQDVVYQGEQIYSNTFKASDKAVLMNLFAKHQIAWGYETYERIFVPNQDNAKKSMEVLKEYGIINVGISDDEVHKDVFQFWIFADAELVSRVEAELKQMDFKYLKWNDSAIEIMPSDESKAKGIAFLKSTMEAKGKNIRTFAFGDGVNDVEMLSFVDESVAMGNASDYVKSHAKHVTNHCTEDGIAKGLESIGLR